LFYPDPVVEHTFGFWEGKDSVGGWTLVPIAIGTEGWVGMLAGGPFGVMGRSGIFTNYFFISSHFAVSLPLEKD
jgi:hypothetical protein